MAHRRRSLHVEITDRHLERRELLSRGTAPPIPSQVETAQEHPVPVNLFHQDGIDGLKLNKSFVNRLNDRINLSISAETRISQAFQVFLQNYQQAPHRGQPWPDVMAVWLARRFEARSRLRPDRARDPEQPAAAVGGARTQDCEAGAGCPGAVRVSPRSTSLVPDSP